MIVLEGQPALSPFRRERLESRLRALSPDVRVAGAWHVYWVEPADAGQAIDSAVLNRILQAGDAVAPRDSDRSEEHTSELQSLMRISYAVFCLKKTKKKKNRQ